jgi:hypothetical protein
MAENASCTPGSMLAHLGELVRHEGPVEGEDVEQLTHLLERRLVAPHPVEPPGDREGDADGAHQHQPADPVREPAGHRERQTATEAVADEVGALDAERVEEPDELGDPLVHAVGARLVAEPEPGHVGGEDAVRRAERRDREAPVGVGADAGAAAVHQHEGRAVPRLQVVGAESAGVDGGTDLGAGGRGHRDECPPAALAPATMAFPGAEHCPLRAATAARRTGRWS